MYFPKSQITSNLYTNGNELFLNGESYIGYYFKTSNGKFFSGKNPSDRPNNELFPISQDFWEITAETETNGINFVQFADNYDGLSYKNQNQDPKTNFIYNTLKPQQSNVLIPYYSPSLPTTQDYQIGEFRRYFCKKTNELLYIEINQPQYKQLVSKDPQILWALYQPFFIDWQLIGDKQRVAQINRNSVDLLVLKQKFFGLNQYLKFDYTKYFQ